MAVRAQDKEDNSNVSLLQSKNIVSTEQINNMLSNYLQINNEGFIQFRDIVQSECNSSIDECYGDFLLFTKPILSYLQLKKMTNSFFENLKIPSEIISQMLNITIRVVVR